jgi:hypothetical protein
LRKNNYPETVCVQRLPLSLLVTWQKVSSLKHFYSLTNGKDLELCTEIVCRLCSVNCWLLKNCSM